MGFARNLAKTFRRMSGFFYRFPKVMRRSGCLEVGLLWRNSGEATLSSKILMISSHFQIFLLAFCQGKLNLHPHEETNLFTVNGADSVHLNRKQEGNVEISLNSSLFSYQLAPDMQKERKGRFQTMTTDGDSIQHTPVLGHTPVFVL